MKLHHTRILLSSLIIITVSSFNSITIGFSLFSKHIRCSLDFAIVGIDASGNAPRLVLMLRLTLWLTPHSSSKTSGVRILLLLMHRIGYRNFYYSSPFEVQSSAQIVRLDPWP